LRVPLDRVLLAIKLFELDTSVRESASQLNLSYNTVYALFNLCRQSIAGSDKDTSFILSGEIEMDESYFGGRRKGNVAVSFTRINSEVITALSPMDSDI
jgi:transposase